MSNIESLISKISYEIVDSISKSNDKTKLKNLIDKALGVLSNNGVYAYYVYIISQKSREATEFFLDKLEDIFNLIKVEEEIKYSSLNREQYFQKISEDIHKLLFLKQLLEKTFIYARYHAKALGEN